MSIFSLRPVQTGGLGSVFFFVLFYWKKEPYFDLLSHFHLLQLSIQTSWPKKLALSSVHLQLGSGLLSRLVVFHSHLFLSLWPKRGLPVCSNSFGPQHQSFEMIFLDFSLGNSDHYSSFPHFSLKQLTFRLSMSSD